MKKFIGSTKKFIKKLEKKSEKHPQPIAQEEKQPSKIESNPIETNEKAETITDEKAEKKKTFESPAEVPIKLYPIEYSYPQDIDSIKHLFELLPKDKIQDTETRFDKDMIIILSVAAQLKAIINITDNTPVLEIIKQISPLTEIPDASTLAASPH